MFRNILKYVIPTNLRHYVLYLIFFLLIYPVSAQTSKLPKLPHTPRPEKVAKENLLNRFGISIAGVPSVFGILFDYDRLGILPSLHWSLGAEIGLYGRDFTVMPRALLWEERNMSGFYAGPKASISNFQQHNESKIFLGIGAEGGWLYRFENNLDVGGGIDLSLTSEGPWGTIRVTAGYLF